MTSKLTPALQCGDVVLVLFPFTSQAAVKKRPAVVVSNDRYNIERPDVVVMAVTSQLTSALSTGDVPIGLWKEAGLLKESAIKPVFATIEQTMITRRLGTLQATDLVALRAGIARIIG